MYTQHTANVFSKYCHLCICPNTQRKPANTAPDCAQWKCIQVHMNSGLPGWTTNLVAFQSNQLPLKYTSRFLFCKKSTLASKHRHEIQTKGQSPPWRGPAWDSSYHPHGPANPPSPCWPLLTPGCQATHHLEAAFIPPSLISPLPANGSMLHFRQKWKSTDFCIPKLERNLLTKRKQSSVSAI